MKVVILDYGMGNTQSLRSTLKYLGASEVLITSEKESILSADRLILPGVGSFNIAMKNLRLAGLEDILRIVLNSTQIPVLGICLGMQLMAQSSTEGGLTQGLRLINAKAERFSDTINYPVPHVGFNQVTGITANNRLFQGLSDSSDFYFTHSFRLKSESKICATYCNYDEDFISSFEADNLFGVQFHPELSQSNGLKLLENFLFKI